MNFHRCYGYDCYGSNKAVDDCAALIHVKIIADWKFNWIYVRFQFDLIIIIIYFDVTTHIFLEQFKLHVNKHSVSIWIELVTMHHKKIN